MKTRFVQYYVEGEDEEQLVKTLKTDLNAILPGKVQKLNVVTHVLKSARLMSLRSGTMVVLIFDTDAGNVNILRENLSILEKCSAVSEIVTVPQVPNLEQELVRSCSIRRIEELLGSKSKTEFKSDLIRISNLADKLREHRFDITRLWCARPPFPYQGIKNLSGRIKRI